jgi:hypothetical protein
MNKSMDRVLRHSEKFQGMGAESEALRFTRMTRRPEHPMQTKMLGSSPMLSLRHGACF